MTTSRPALTFGRRPSDQGLSKIPSPNAAKPGIFGSALVAFYVFLITGRILDVSPIWFLHIPLILLVMLTVTMISRGDFTFAFSSNLTKYFAAFTAWVVICFPFSSWRFASLPQVQLQAQCLVIFMIIVQVIRTQRDWARVAGAYAYAILVAALLSFVIGINVQGRIALPNGTLGDPNEFALYMVTGLPFWWYKASNSIGFKKVFYLLCTLPIYLAFARAGSRAGLLALGIVFLVTFLFAEGGRKVLIATVAVVGIGASSFLLPGYLKARFTTFFSPAEGNFDAATQARIASDIASSEERRALLMQSLSMTFRHPVVGVGPGTFSFVSRDERISKGEAGGENLVTHNTYTQISSETGLPGFFFFAGTVFLAVRYVYSDFHRLIGRDRDLAQCGKYLFTTMAGLSVGIFFLSVGYTHFLGVMFALALSLHRLALGVQAAQLPSTGTRSFGRSLPATRPPVDRSFSPKLNGRARNQYPSLPQPSGPGRISRAIES